MLKKNGFGCLVFFIGTTLAMEKIKDPASVKYFTIDDKDQTMLQHVVEAQEWKTKFGETVVFEIDKKTGFSYCGDVCSLSRHYFSYLVGNNFVYLPETCFKRTRRGFVFAGLLILGTKKEESKDILLRQCSLLCVED